MTTPTSRLVLAFASLLGLSAGIAVAQNAASQPAAIPADQLPEIVPDALLDDIMNAMSGSFVSSGLRIHITPIRAIDADRVLFAAAETGEGDTMGQVFFHIFRFEGQPRIRMVRLPGGAAAAPGLYAAMDAIGAVQLGQLDVTGDLTPVFDAATGRLQISSERPMPTYAGGAIAMNSRFEFTPSGMTISENGVDIAGATVWTFPEGDDGNLRRVGPAPVAVQTDTGLRYHIVAEGDEHAQVGVKGDTYTVNYTGWLPSGQMFDTSKQPGREPFTVQIPGGVIQGWNEGLIGMKVGEKRRLFIPPALGYGERGAGNVIPPNSWLIFDVELLSLAKEGSVPAGERHPHDHDGDGIPDH